MLKMIVYAILAIVFLAVAGSIYAATKTPKPVDLMNVVEAIRQVENWDGTSIGAANERGPWQMTRSAWFEHTTRPFWWASGYKREHRDEQHRVALERVTWIRDHLVNIPLSESAYSIALVFTCGYRGVKHGKPSADKRAYAQRVQNIYDQLTK